MIGEPLKNTNVGFWILKTKEGSNKMALNIALLRENALIITNKHKFVPLLETIIKLRNKVYIIESENHFNEVKKHILGFKIIIIVNMPLNEFETEFYKQLANKMGKIIILVELCLDE